MKVARCLRPLRSRSDRLSVARQHRINSRDETVELRHVVLEEFPCRFVVNLSVIVDQAAFELDVRLDRVHLWRIAERQNAAQMLLDDRSSNLSRRRPDEGRRFSRKRVLAVGPTRPVDRILQAARNRAVVLGRDE